MALLYRRTGRSAPVQKVEKEVPIVNRLGLQPRIAQLRPLEIVQVEMGVDQRNVGHQPMFHPGRQVPAAAERNLPLARSSAGAK